MMKIHIALKDGSQIMANLCVEHVNNGYVKRI